MSKEHTNQPDNFDQIEGALSQGEQFIEKNQKQLLTVVLVIVALVGAWFGYQKMISEPRNTEAAAQIYGAQRYFERDSFNLALNGDGNTLGFLDIVDNYGSTPSGNLANLYAGICYLNLGENQKAIESLKQFSSDDFLLSSMAVSNIADAYMQMGDFAKAADYYGQAAGTNRNEFSTPYILMKQGLALEKAGKADKAVAVYETIETEYPNSMQAREVEKYISRAKLTK